MVMVIIEVLPVLLGIGPALLAVLLPLGDLLLTVAAEILAPLDTLRALFLKILGSLREAGLAILGPRRLSHLPGPVGRSCHAASLRTTGLGETRTALHDSPEVAPAAHSCARGKASATGRPRTGELAAA
jgi:hypothetical protein